MTSMTAVDLFAGAGGTTRGAEQNGIKVLWAANHKQNIIDIHALNHPETEHSCQDLQQADFSLVPEHDLFLASPCCQGHSAAAGKRKKLKSADDSRSTAWAVINGLDVHRSPLGLIENVDCFRRWELYPMWKQALNAMGYSVSENLVDLSDLGYAQNRKRLFIALTRSKHPIKLRLPYADAMPASSNLDLNFEGHNWDLVSDRCAATQRRVALGRKQHGDIFLDKAYGSTKGGRSIHKPIGTITTVNVHSLVMGDYIRPITVEEAAKFQTFPDDYIWSSKKTLNKEMIGNAVPPEMSRIVIQSFLEAA